MEMHHENLYQLSSPELGYQHRRVDQQLLKKTTSSIDTPARSKRRRELPAWWPSAHPADLRRRKLDRRGLPGLSGGDEQQQNHGTAAGLDNHRLAGSSDHRRGHLVGRAGIQLQSASSLLESSGLVDGGGGGSNSVRRQSQLLGVRRAQERQANSSSSNSNTATRSSTSITAGRRRSTTRTPSSSTPPLVQNTDGSIYTLTRLENSEPSSMDGLDCRSPNSASVTDNWMRSNQLSRTLRPLFNMEDATAMSTMSVAVSSNPARTTTTGSISDRNNAEEQQQQQQPQPQAEQQQEKTQQQQQQSTESADESLLRNALQGKIYPSNVAAGLRPAGAAVLGAGTHRDRCRDHCQRLDSLASGSVERRRLLRHGNLLQSRAGFATRANSSGNSRRPLSSSTRTIRRTTTWARSRWLPISSTPSSSKTPPQAQDISSE
ncbi:unnamed protein product [Trichogramma brassicae]|uniref:Uncharacterized protein n=1 Tax=Trichogramma brassicae TaxID=86971 RepID=A0A6H5IS18_9HYME|nr:unnamed protein product [Trichogramma brassicae]